MAVSYLNDMTKPLNPGGPQGTVGVRQFLSQYGYNPGNIGWDQGAGTFSLKGSIAGLLWAGASIWIFRPDFWTSLIYFLTIPAISAFLAMNFTGASTFTTLSGVKLEVRIVTPFAAVLCAASLALGILQTINVI